MTNKALKGYSTGYSKKSCTLAESLTNTGLILYKGIVYYIYIYYLTSVRLHSYGLHNRYNRSAMHSTLCTYG